MVLPTSDSNLEKDAKHVDELESFCKQCKDEDAITKHTGVNWKKLVYILSFVCICSIFANFTSVVVYILHDRNVAHDFNNGGAGNAIDNIKTAQERLHGMNSAQTENLVKELYDVDDIVTEPINKLINEPSEPEARVDDGHTKGHDEGSRMEHQCLTSEQVTELVDEKLGMYKVRVQSFISEQNRKERQAIVKMVQRIESNNDTTPGRKCQLIGRSRFTPPVTPEYVNNVMGRADIRTDRRQMFIQEWGGTLFRNRRFRTAGETPITLKFFQEEVQADDGVDRLFDHDNGVFTARATGLYHIYAHIPYYNHDSGPIALKHRHFHKGMAGKEETVFGCTKSINYHHTYKRKQSQGVDYSYRICSMAGSIEVERGDRFWLHTVHPNVTFGLSQGDCYFGAFAYAI